MTLNTILWVFMRLRSSGNNKTSLNTTTILPTWSENERNTLCTKAVQIYSVCFCHESSLTLRKQCHGFCWHVYRTGIAEERWEEGWKQKGSKACSCNVSEQWCLQSCSMKPRAVRAVLPGGSQLKWCPVLLYDTGMLCLVHSRGHGKSRAICSFHPSRWNICTCLCCSPTFFAMQVGFHTVWMAHVA